MYSLVPPGIANCKLQLILRRCSEFGRFGGLQALQSPSFSRAAEAAPPPHGKKGILGRRRLPKPSTELPGFCLAYGQPAHGATGDAEHSKHQQRRAEPGLPLIEQAA